MNRDIKIGKFGVSLNGVELVQDTTLELNYGRRYGLIGMKHSKNYNKNNILKSTY